MRLESRTGKDLTGTYPEVRAAIAAQQARDLLLDGEVVAYDGDQTSFTRLQQRLGVTRPAPEQVVRYPVVYCVFDPLEVDGEDLTDRPSVDRRARLTRTIRSSSALQQTEAWRDDSQQRFAEACQSGWEGLIAKRARCSVRRRPLEELVETEVRLGAGARHRRLHRSRRLPDGLWCFLVGYYEEGSLRYAGRSAPATRSRLFTTLVSGYAGWRRPSRLSWTHDRFPRGAHWTRPELVAQIGFAEWTSDGRLRQPRFLGLRDDKSAAEVVREQPQ